MLSCALHLRFWDDDEPATDERFAGTQYQSFGLVLWSLVTASVQEEEEFRNIYKNQNQKRKNPKRR